MTRASNGINVEGYICLSEFTNWKLGYLHFMDKYWIFFRIRVSSYLYLQGSKVNIDKSGFSETTHQSAWRYIT